MSAEPVICDFLDQHRLAFVGVSRDVDTFSAAVYRALVDHGYEILAVNRRADSVQGRPCWHRVEDLPDGLGGAIVMVPGDQAVEVVQSCIDRDIPRVWLHRGMTPSALLDEAAARCAAHGVPCINGDELTALLALRAAVGSTAAQIEQMATAVASRDIIGQAKGILMARQRVDADEAFEILRRASQRLNRKVRDVARDLVEGACPLAVGDKSGSAATGGRP
ncbi:MAG: CoA-binding protein [Acidimicrobiales bacterium]|nr:CoA-binding protein [Acidimicrobiales bacterium]